MAQSKRERARDSRGRPISGLYIRDGKYSCGYRAGGKWKMINLSARTITEAKREQQSLLSGLREGRVAASDSATFLDCFAEWQASREISERTREHEKGISRRYLSELTGRRVQDITPTDVARILRGMRGRYSSWTQVHAFKVMNGTLELAERRGIITRNPLDRLSSSEKPKQRNAREVERLDAATLEKLIAAGGSERWRAALALAGFAGLRAGEIRAMRWGDIDLEGEKISVSRSALPDGTMKSPKSAAGVRVVPLLPSCRRRLVEWKLKSPKTDREDLIIGTAEGKAIAPENLRRAMSEAKKRAGLDGSDARLSLHSLRHSFASLLVTDMKQPITTAALVIGHASSDTTLRLYARDARTEESMVADFLERAAAAHVGS